jgi:hypothetical protein
VIFNDNEQIVGDSSLRAGEGAGGIGDVSFRGRGVILTDASSLLLASYNSLFTVISIPLSKKFEQSLITVNALPIQACSDDSYCSGDECEVRTPQHTQRYPL